MVLNLSTRNQVLISISVVSGAIALTLTCVGIGAPNWQNISANTTNGQTYTISTGNFFYACLFDSNGVVLTCDSYTTGSNVTQYYSMNTQRNQTGWNIHLKSAAGLSIIGIIYIFLGTVATLLMLTDRFEAWIFLMGPSFLFLACLFMLAGLAEGARVFYYNGYAANLYETAHLFTIFSFLISAIVAGRLFDPPQQLEKSIKVKRKN